MTHDPELGFALVIIFLLVYLLTAIAAMVLGYPLIAAGETIMTMGIMLFVGRNADD